MKHDYDTMFAILKAARFNEMLITGSFLIKPKEANDINLVFKFKYYDDVENSIDERLIEIGAVYSENEAYICDRDGTIFAVMRLHQYNIIIVYDEEAYGLWKEATAELVKNPHLYMDKNDRTEMFMKIKERYVGE